MKKCVLLLVAFVFQNCLAQNQKGYNIEYTVKWIESDYVGHSRLVYNDFFSFYYIFNDFDKLKDSMNFSSLMINHAQFCDLKQNLIYGEVNYPIGNTYIIKEKVKMIDWKISSEIKSILGYSCYKATALIKSRKVVVWFNSELGNGKMLSLYGGLPGVPLEIIDKKRRWVINAINISRSNYTFFLPNVKMITK
jgi:GLPGLI family protein